MDATLAEGDSRPGDQITHGTRHEYLIGISFCGNPRPRMYRHPGQIAARHLTLTGVQPGPNRQAEIMNTLDDRLRTSDRSGGPVERRKKPVAGMGDLAAAISQQLTTDQGIVMLEDVAPPAVPEVRLRDWWTPRCR